MMCHGMVTSGYIFGKTVQLQRASVTARKLGGSFSVSLAENVPRSGAVLLGKAFFLLCILWLLIFCGESRALFSPRILRSDPSKHRWVAGC